MLLSFLCRNYKFDLSIPLDRLAAIRLAEISADENYYIKVCLYQRSLFRKFINHLCPHNFN